MIIQNNLMAMNAQRQNSLNNMKLQTSLMKLSSGYRINSAADDAAGLAISERMRAQQTGVERAILNAQDGSSMIQTAEGALTEVHSILNRLTDLANQAANGTLQDSQRASINKEAGDLLKEIDRISKATNFNGVNLLDGSLSRGGQGVATSGVRTTETAAVAGEYTTDAMQPVAGLSGGDVVSFTLGMNNGTSTTMNFTISDDLATMTAGDGTVYDITGAINAGAIDVDGDVFADAVADQLKNTSAAGSFTISQSGDTISFASREAGTGAARITGLSYAVNNNGSTAVNVNTTTPPADAQRAIEQSALRLFDGSNESQATFSINGQNFVLVNDADYADTISKLQSGDVTAIRVQGTSGASLTADDLTTIAANVNHRTGLALEADAGKLVLKAPSGGDGLNLQIGDTADAFNRMNVAIGDMSVAGLGLGSISFTTQEAAANALSRISSAIETVSSARGTLGAQQNRLESTIRNLQVTNENLTAAESRIRDTDMAKSMMDFIRQNVLSQSSQAMMAQANMQSQQVLQLLR